MLQIPIYTYTFTNHSLNIYMHLCFCGMYGIWWAAQEIRSIYFSNWISFVHTISIELIYIIIIIVIIIHVDGCRCRYSCGLISILCSAIPIITTHSIWFLGSRKIFYHRQFVAEKCIENCTNHIISNSTSIILYMCSIYW